MGLLSIMTLSEWIVKDNPNVDYLINKLKNSHHRSFYEGTSKYYVFSDKSYIVIINETLYKTGKL